MSGDEHAADGGVDDRQQDREQIELRVAGLRSPRRLEILARSRFGLIVVGKNLCISFPLTVYLF
jgi:hypothetical protein